MEGWKLKEAHYLCKDISDDEIWKNFNFIFSTRSTNRTSYKYGFLKALLESVFDVNEEGGMRLSDIFSKFTAIYWSLVVKFKLKKGDKGVKGGKTKIEEIFENYINQYDFIKISEYDCIRKDIRNQIEKDITKECSKYVVGALYGDSSGMFYSFYKKENYLEFNPSVLKFIRKYNSMLLKLNHYEWIKFLEKVNLEENSYGIASKLDEAAKRTHLKLYKDFLYINLENHTCFYCGKQVEYNGIHIDHFVPWSFIRNNKLWNFVISCSTCNLSKNDKLADKYFLDEIIYRDNHIRHCDFEIVKSDFESYNDHLFKEIYSSAIFNGFDENWKPRGIIVPKDIEVKSLILT
jgi:hypothetical protein